ncbi:MAG TPA: ABC transporter permease [Thermoanaerobaculia bacterium]|nr:ABC transporter permease [Thermoanaerobaculia bacterium]
MRQARVLYHLMRADFLERVRRYSFLVTLALATWLGWAVSTGKIKLWISDIRGIYNSAWVGVLMAMVVNFFIALAGFYVVKNSIERDRRTGVGQILATTPLSKPLYTLGKALSNLAVLLAMVAVLAVMAVVAQFVVGEDTHVQLGPLLAPILVFCVPAMALVAAFAVLFETIPFLKGGFGNVVWFFAYVSVIPLAIKGHQDPLGMGPVTSSLFAAVKRVFGITTTSFVLGGIDREANARTFRWEGMDWTGEILLGRLAWLALAVGVTLVAALLFDRFDTSRSWAPSRGRQKAGGADNGLVPALAAEAAPIPVHLHPLPAGSRRFRFFDLLRAELRLLLKGQRWWWYMVAAGLIIAGFAVPEEGRKIVLPLAWMWPILLWSPMGNREARFATDGLVFSAAWPLQRQLPATWLAGVLLALVTGGGVGLRLALTGHWAGLGAWLVGALFIPTFALALGVWSGSGKLFEAVYLFLWYIGPLNQTRPLDFMGVVPAAVKAGVPLAWLAATVALGVAGVVGRRRQVG